MTVICQRRTASRASTGPDPFTFSCQENCRVRNRMLHPFLFQHCDSVQRVEKPSVHALEHEATLNNVFPNLFCGTVNQCRQPSIPRIFPKYHANFVTLISRKSSCGRQPIHQARGKHGSHFAPTHACSSTVPTAKTVPRFEHVNIAITENMSAYAREKAAINQARQCPYEKQPPPSLDKWDQRPSAIRSLTPPCASNMLNVGVIFLLAFQKKKSETDKKANLSKTLKIHH